jgi:hypothetical protein
MRNGPLGTFQAGEGATDQILAGLGQHLDRHIVRYPTTVDQAAHEIEIGLRRRWKSDLNFFEAHADQQIEKRRLRSLSIGSINA